MGRCTTLFYRFLKAILKNLINQEPDFVLNFNYYDTNIGFLYLSPGLKIIFCDQNASNYKNIYQKTKGKKPKHDSIHVNMLKR